MKKKLTDWDKMVIDDLAEIERRIESGEEKTYSLDDTLKFMDETVERVKKERENATKKGNKNGKKSRFASVQI